MPVVSNRSLMVLTGAVLGASCAVALGLPKAGVAAKATTVVKLAKSSDLNRQIVVDSKGRSVYVLTGETRKKLLCKSSACLKAWPLVTVKSKKTKIGKGKGVTGKVTLLKRGKRYQVLLAGKPLYLYAGDSTGKASGEGIKSFGGTWLTISGSGASSGGSDPSTEPPIVAY